jgi:hypothetical protein
MDKVPGCVLPQVNQAAKKKLKLEKKKGRRDLRRGGGVAAEAGAGTGQDYDFSTDFYQS